MGVVSDVAKPATQIATRLGRAAKPDEVKTATQALVDRGVSRDMFQLSGRNTFYITVPNIPGIRFLVAAIKQFRIRYLAQKAGLKDVAIITNYGERMANKNLAQFNRIEKLKLQRSGLKAQDLHAGLGSFAKIGSTGTTVSWYNLRAPFKFSCSEGLGMIKSVIAGKTGN